MWKCVTFARIEAVINDLITIYIFQYLDEANESNRKKRRRRKKIVPFLAYIEFKILDLLPQKAAKENNSKEKNGNFPRIFLRYFSIFAEQRAAIQFQICALLKFIRNDKIEQQHKNQIPCECMLFHLLKRNWFHSYLACISIFRR